MDKKENEFTSTIFLGYLTEQVFSMLFGYGFLQIAVNGGSQPFDESHLLLGRKRAVARQFKLAVWQRQESK